MPRSTESEFEEFAALRYPGLRRTAYLLCGDWHSAEDLVQGALVKLYARWHRLRDPRSAAAYARTVIVRAHIDTRRLRSSTEVTTPDLPEQPTVSPDSDRQLVLLAALAELRPQYRAVLVLRYWEDQSVAETARILGLREGTVRSDSHRALAQLRAVLGEASHDITGA
ncbi:SigE family RNA polymerase sigma factor [Kitasatospora sp. Root107]|uniref:SigE family RNA polymerase sigma factor n=1 Tax=Kitasatospora sp. Root107 TaxID=1736424 RepID=UPI0007097566|nr:SigE family RNA polymerase sigma factor [Kitasatospora sp. Root107]KQV13538.1 RNA polymerase subunit sigma-24 [Kitasatospora sp. Root107]